MAVEGLIPSEWPIESPDVMRERSDGEGKFIYVPRVSQQRENKVATTHVMCEVAEELFSEWVVPEILNNATAVSERMSFPQAGLGSAGIVLEQKWPDGIVPGEVDQFFMCECRITKSASWRRHGQKHQSHDRRIYAFWRHRISFWRRELTRLAH